MLLQLSVDDVFGCCTLLCALRRSPASSSWRCA